MKYTEIKKLSEDEKEKKLKEIKTELVKLKTSATKTGSAKLKEIKKIRARILTLNSLKAKEKFAQSEQKL